MELKKIYDPLPVEEKWYKYWIEQGLFIADPNSPRPSFSMVIPPPNITGSLHMGHALNNTLQDVLVRYKKMDGFNVLWIPGTDHAGIATQNVVERLLREEGMDRKDLKREVLIERIWRWKKESGRTIVNQLKRLGAGCDWSRERFTMDPGLSKAVREVFVRLYDEGLIYRDNYMINWCPRCETALSDLEVEHKDTRGNLYYINYPLKDGRGTLIIATTRPETMLGDTAVAVHPEDERYKMLIGKEVLLPLTDRIIPIIGDEYVDISFGTGALKITPAHDQNDFLIGLRHQLPQIEVIGKNGKMTVEAGKSFSGMDRFQCREKVIESLKCQGLLSKVEDYSHSVGHCYRCDTVIEPLVSLQWFVRMQELAEPAIKAVKDGRIRFVPARWENTFFSWMENIKDWCISRQIFWGHRIPVWYCGTCNGEKIWVVFRNEKAPESSGRRPIGGGTYSELRRYGFTCQEIMENLEKYTIDVVGGESIIVSKETPGACPVCGGSELIQDPDVLDTWFSSALWPFSTMGWPESTRELEVFYPTSVLVTSFDIIFFWVSRMIMMGLKFMGDVPFRDVYIHALVRDAYGQKMSKSRGNVIDPLVMMDKYGTDALRFTLVALAAQGRDIKLSEERMEGYRNFVNKLWNAARFIFMNMKDYNEKTFSPDTVTETLMDRWIQSRLQFVIEEVRQGIEDYKFNEAASSIYQFVWHEFCDWYIEAAKPVLAGEKGLQARKSCQRNLLEVLQAILKLLHPFMPFLTEEIWRGIGNKDSILLERFPEMDNSRIDEGASIEAGFIMDVIKGIRNLRSEINIPIFRLLDIVYINNGSRWADIVREEEGLIRRLARVSSISPVVERPVHTIPLVLEKLDVFVLLKGAVDIKEEEKRIRQNIDKINRDISYVQKKLANEKFLKNAPVEIVEREKKKAQELSKKMNKLKEQMERIKSI